MPREYVKYRSVSENAIRTFAASILCGALFSLFVLGGMKALQQFILAFAVMAAVVGSTYMLFSYSIVKIPGWPLLLVGLGLFAMAGWIYAEDIVKGLGFQLLPFSFIDGQFTISPTIVLGFVLGFLLLGVLAVRRK